MSSPSDTATENSELSPYTVVLVDDEGYILEALKRTFRREPYGFICAASGALGLEVLARTPRVAVVISDQRMPEMDGSVFLARSRELAPGAIRMLLTGHSDMEATVAAMNEGGATRYIRKPWEDLELLQTVRESVRQYHLVLANSRQQEIIKEQHEEIVSWNQNLKSRVLTQTSQLRMKAADLHTVNHRLQKNCDGMIESFSALLELRAPKSRPHSVNTATLSVAMARSLGLSAAETETVRIAALLHDIGKNAMSDNALVADEGSFNAEEMLQYRMHPVLGQTAIDSIEDLRGAGVFIRQHHERYDGRGFPDGLAGDAIAPGAAIIALADYLDREMAFHIGGNIVERVLEIVALDSGAVYAPYLFQHLAKPAHELYARQLDPADDRLTELELGPLQLKEGMVLTTDLYSRSGLFLLEAWTTLDRDKIKAIQRIFALDPKPAGITVGVDQATFSAAAPPATRRSWRHE